MVINCFSRIVPEMQQLWQNVRLLQNVSVHDLQNDAQLSVLTTLFRS